jgi:Tfp pilus assembly protein PilX
MKRILKQEKGIALVIALMMILVMSVLVAGFMLTVTTEQKLGSNQVRYMEALNDAEAGISEAVARLSPGVGTGYFIGETGSPSSAKWEARIVNNASPTNVSGSSITYYSSIQTGATNVIPYTVTAMTGADSVYVLSIKYKTNSDTTGIYYYDQSTGQQILVSGPPYNAPNDKSFPIWIVTATGMEGSTRRTMIAELTKNRLEANVTSAVATDCPSNADGYYTICGHNHKAATPDYTKIKKGMNDYPCWEEGWELCDHTDPAKCLASGCLRGLTSTGDNIEVQPGNSGGEFGYPEGVSENGEFKELYEVLGAANDADMRSKYDIHTINSETDLKAYYAANGNKGFVEYTGPEIDAGWLPATTEGILWIKGPAKITDKKAFRGIIYVEGELGMSNDFWTLGAILCKGDTINYPKAAGGASTKRGLHFRGNADILYSSEAIQNALQQITSSGGVRRISWREINL